VKANNAVSLEHIIDKYFDLFTPTTDLVERLIAARENAQDVLLLLCARLDALASSISSEDRSNREAFTKLVIAYGGERKLMESVSMGNLYYELGFHRWLMEGMIPKPGRIVRFSRLDDPIIDLIELSDIPLTTEAASNLLTRLMKAIERHFRCRPRQPLTKPNTVKIGALTAAIEEEFKRSRTIEIEKVSTAIQPLLQSQTMAGLLYGNFRNAAIHGVKVNLEERQFFGEAQPYWQPLYSEYYPPFMSVKFPGPFLLRLLRNCIGSLRATWIAKGKVPTEAHCHIFGFGLDELGMLDRTLLPTPTTLRIQRSRR